MHTPKWACTCWQWQEKAAFCIVQQHRIHSLRDGIKDNGFWALHRWLPRFAHSSWDWLIGPKDSLRFVSDGRTGAQTQSSQQSVINRILWKHFPLSAKFLILFFFWWCCETGCQQKFSEMPLCSCSYLSFMQWSLCDLWSQTSCIWIFFICWLCHSLPQKKLSSVQTNYTEISSSKDKKNMSVMFLTVPCLFFFFFRLGFRRSVLGKAKFHRVCFSKLFICRCDITC